MNVFWELLLVVLLLVGSFFILMGGIGLVKLSEFFRRLHAPTKASTLGVGCVLVASVGYHLFMDSDPQPRELLITAFLLITAPIGAHLMAKAALALHMAQRPPLPDCGTVDGRPAGDPVGCDEPEQPPT